MLYGIIIFFHIIVCVGLILVVLVQSGRGGGLSQSFSGAESIFGTKTNSFLTRSTTVFAVAFFITCLSLTFVSKQRSKSLLEGKNIKSTPAKAQDKKAPAAPAEEKKEEAKPEQEEKKEATAVQENQAVEVKEQPVKEESKAQAETQK